MVVNMCMFNQLGKYHVKDMNVYIEPRIYEVLKLWVGISMNDISIPIRRKQFQFHGILALTIHGDLGLTHFCGM